MNAEAEDRLPESEVVGQVKSVLSISFSFSCLRAIYSLFISAGQDTTSHALSRILDQLAHNPELQTKLRKEIREAREANGRENFDYDTLISLPYLDAVCRETLRLYPPVSDVKRV